MYVAVQSGKQYQNHWFMALNRPSDFKYLISLYVLKWESSAVV